MPRPKKSRFAFLRWLLLFPLPVAWILLEHDGLLTRAENWTEDIRYRFRGEIQSPVKVVYVNVDTESLEEEGNFPWTRDYFVNVIPALLQEGGVRAVGFDFLMSPLGKSRSVDLDKARIGDQALVELIYKIPPAVPPPAVFAASFASATATSQRQFPLVGDGAASDAQIEPPETTSFQFRGGTIEPPLVGLIDTFGMRTIPMWAPSRVRTYFPLSVELCRLYWGIPRSGVKVTDRFLEMVRESGEVMARVPLRNGQLSDVNWFSPWSSDQNPAVSFWKVKAYAELLKSEVPDEVAAAKEFFGQDAFKDAIVLIGPTDPLMQDIDLTPMDGNERVPRVSIHGNMIKTMMSGLYLQRAESRETAGIVLVLTAIVSLFAAARVRLGWLAKTAAGLVLAGYIGAAFWLFNSQNWVLPLVAPLGSVFTTTFVAIGWQWVNEQREKGRIKGMFGTYVSPELVSQMVEAEEDPQLGGHEEEITAYFSDIQSFSSFSEKLPPARLVELMNEYLTACTDIVQGEKGTLDKYIGDAVVAMFGAPLPVPDHAYRACVASQLVHQRLAELRKKWKDEGDKWPEIVWKMQSRIGLNSGLATIGNMGSRTRFNYTMMGDNVNLAARMESGAKSWGAYTMVTEATRAACAAHDSAGRVVFRPLGRIVVMGRSQPVPIFEIVGLKENVADSARECIALFEKALAHYYAQEWDAAIQMFKRSSELEPNQPGKTPGVKLNPSLVYLNITEDYRAAPPAADWDGVYVMKEK